MASEIGLGGHTTKSQALLADAVRVNLPQLLPGKVFSPEVALTGLQFLASKRALPMASSSDLCNSIWNTQKGRQNHATKAERWTGVDVVEVVEGESSGLTTGWRTYAREYSPPIPMLVFLLSHRPLASLIAALNKRLSFPASLAAKYGHVTEF